MKVHHLTVTKTARYYTLGELNNETSEVLIVLHGFAQSAAVFIQSFQELSVPHRFIIAPEALNRFYVRGAKGEVGATWMTSDDRLSEISDYCNYLESLITSFNLDNIKLIALGFSQGASTLTRWVQSSKHHFDKVIVYAGQVAPELIPLTPNSNLLATKNYYIVGDQDPFFTPHIVAELKTQYLELNFEYVHYSGNHTINQQVIGKLL